MADELTAAAKAMIADAVRTVREDKFAQYVRGRLDKHTGTPTPPPTGAPSVDPPKPKEGDPPTDPTGTPPSDDKPPRSAYWGVFEDE